MYYQGKRISRTVTIGEKSVIVDSQLEERVIRYLDSHGFHDRWDKPAVGLNVGASNYTPDVELSVLVDGMTHRAIVEIKPAKHYATPYILHRMANVAAYYHSNVLLLYADQERSWYRIDIKTHTLTPCTFPTPSTIPIAQLYKPASLPAQSVYDHQYTKAALPTIGNAFLEFVVALITAPFTTSTKQKRTRTSRYR
jgi:hypothetical protein